MSRGWPRPRALRNVRVRVTAAASVAALVVAAIGGVLFVSSLRNFLQQGLVSAGHDQVQLVRAQLRKESPQQAVVSGKNDVLVQIIDADGVVIASDHPRVHQPLRRTPGTAYEVRLPGLADDYVVVAEKQNAKSDRIIAVGRSAEGVEQATVATGVLLATSLPVALGLLALVVWLSVGRALRPVEAMRRQAREITTAHRRERLAMPAGDDEIPRLAETLNAMLDRIDASTRLQQQFVSDASHELRSPLAALRQVAEIARDYPDRADAGRLASDVLAEEARMEDLVGALLLLARLDDAESARLEPVDLDDLVLEEVRRTRGTLPAGAGVTLAAGEVGAAQVDGDPVLLRQVVRNLLTNAVRHARSQVLVSLHEEGGQARLSVQDDGNGVPPEERGRVFERFLRLDEARARDAGGSGLGLAIVEKIVTDLGGRAAVGESRMGGADFVITLPVGSQG